jgi:hypothetical protein
MSIRRNEDGCTGKGAILNGESAGLKLVWIDKGVVNLVANPDFLVQL